MLLAFVRHFDPITRVLRYKKNTRKPSFDPVRAEESYNKRIVVPDASCNPLLPRVLLVLCMFFLCSTFQNLPPFIRTCIRVSRVHKRTSPLARKYAHHTKLRTLSHKGTANTFCNPNNACVDKMT